MLCSKLKLMQYPNLSLEFYNFKAGRLTKWWVSSLGYYFKAIQYTYLKETLASLLVYGNIQLRSSRMSSNKTQYLYNS